MKTLLAIVAVSFLAACNSCAPQPVPVPPVPVVVIVDAGPTPAPVVTADAGPPAPQPDIDPSVRGVCVNLAALGCPEGGPSCPVVLQRAFVERITVVPLDCLISAHSKDDVHACGKFVACK